MERFQSQKITEKPSFGLFREKFTYILNDLKLMIVFISLSRLNHQMHAIVLNILFRGLITTKHTCKLMTCKL